MRHRSPARFLAPLALVAFAVALFVVIGSSTTDDEQPATPATTVEQTAGERSEGERAEKSEKRKPRRPRTYTVQAGDTPSGIAAETGVPLERIEELNPDLDPQSLNVGDEIRIR